MVVQCRDVAVASLSLGGGVALPEGVQGSYPTVNASTIPKFSDAVVQQIQQWGEEETEYVVPEGHTVQAAGKVTVSYINGKCNL